MRFTNAIFVAALPVLAAAQYGPPPPAAGGGSPSSSAAPSVPSAPANTNGTVNVNVAPNGQFVFSPSNFTAPNGTVVNFFFPNAGLQHSVTQSSFANPCTYLQASNSSSAGFDSGLQEAVQFTITITNDQEPIWFFCKQLTHCGLGMVGAINAANDTFQTFQSAAMAIGSSGEPTATAGGFASGGVNADATAAPANTATSTSSSSSSGATRIVASGVAGLIAVSLAMLFA